METPITEKFVINEARAVLLLLEAGKEKEAAERISILDAQFRKQAVKLDTDVQALWEQVGIAASNLSNQRYFEDTKEELNRVTFKWSQSKK